MPTYIIPLSSKAVTPGMAGGKGANLCKLVGFGVPVPPGFIITTEAYDQFIAINQLVSHINLILSQIDHNSPQSLDEGSEGIRSLFKNLILVSELRSATIKAYQKIGCPPVAVRSSATAEDLPEISFAGQQDTYLNVIGEQALLDSILNCWSSLWTGRAIGYRFRHHISQENLSIAVIVQQMVQSEISGVVFTANPLNGIRNQIVINATLGYGEALVSGKVDADQFIVSQNHQILSKQIGEKAISIRGQASGGVITQSENASQYPSLTDDLILRLAQLCQKIAVDFSEPQDIEWAIVGDELFVLQSRPITSLFPLPGRITIDPLKVFASFAAVQGVVNPITPLGQQILQLAFTGISRLFGYQNTLATQTILLVAGERLWINITPIVKNTIGRKIIPAILNLVEPTIRQAILSIIDDPRLQPDHKGIRFATKIRLARFLIPVAGNVLLNFLAPEKRRDSSNRWIESFLASETIIYNRVTGSREEKLAKRIENLERLMLVFPGVFPRLVSLVAAGMASLNLINTLGNRIEVNSAEEKAENAQLTMEITRGLPNNVTTEMDLALWQVARKIQLDPQSLLVFTESSPEYLVRAYENQRLPIIAQQAISQFFCTYQMRGIGEIDIGRERWKENPLQVFQTLNSYLKITDLNFAPDIVFKRGAEASLRAQKTLIEKLGQQKHGWIKQKIAKAAIRRYRAIGGMRETPKFTIIRFTGVIRMTLLESGADYVRDGILDHADDLFFLTIEELKELASDHQKDWKALILSRRLIDEREKNRHQIPKMLMSDGHAFYEGMSSVEGQGDDILIGYPVSAGLVEGNAHIVLDPKSVTLLPGEILVCPGTDPAWTPLFLAAGGLVMEVGGLMTHGAVVAREYGIPAVVGVERATQRILNGQRIRVNGTTGQVEILN